MIKVNDHDNNSDCELVLFVTLTDLAFLTNTTGLKLLELTLWAYSVTVV